MLSKTFVLKLAQSGLVTGVRVPGSLDSSLSARYSGKPASEIVSDKLRIGPLVRSHEERRWLSEVPIQNCSSLSNTLVYEENGDWRCTTRSQARSIRPGRLLALLLPPLQSDGVQDFRTENGSRKRQNLALTGLRVPSPLDSGLSAR
jgi:hypothetical protein